MNMLIHDQVSLLAVRKLLVVISLLLPQLMTAQNTSEILAQEESGKYIPESDTLAGKVCHETAYLRFQAGAQRELPGGQMKVRPSSMTLFFTQSYICGDEGSNRYKRRHLKVVIPEELIMEGRTIHVPEEVISMTFMYDHGYRYIKPRPGQEVVSLLHQGSIEIIEDNPGKELLVKFNLEFQDADNITLPRELKEEVRFVCYPE